MAPEQLRSFLFIGLAVIAFMLWQSWQQDYGRKPAQNTSTNDQLQTGTVPSGATQVNPNARPPSTEDVPNVPQSATTAQASAKIDEPADSGTDLVWLETDVQRVAINPIGGTIVRVELIKYPVSIETPNIPFALLEISNDNYFVAQTGLLGDKSLPTHHTPLTVLPGPRFLERGKNSLTLRMSVNEEGLVVEKAITLYRDRYLIDIDYVVKNERTETLKAQMYGQIQRSRVDSTGGLFRTYTYTGGVLSGPENPYEKVDFDDMVESPVEMDVKGGWVAMIQHYFAGALIPSPDETNHFFAKALKNGRFAIGVVNPIFEVGSGADEKLSLQLYAGPKVQQRMLDAAKDLNRTVDYGWLFMIAEPLFTVINWIHGVVGNWGWSIIIVTLLIKLIFFPLSTASYKSMARMRKLQPRMQQLRERYGDDRQKLNEGMMKMYKEEKINPLGGCLPILVQIPVFISLYWVLLETVELRQASFIFWLDDLSNHDPFFVLPVLMGITMLAQQRLNPSPPDPMQAKIMMALPFVFTFLFLFFPSGLVLYWFVNNLLSIAQQWVITKKIVNEKK